MVKDDSINIIFLSVESVLYTLRSTLAYGDVAGGFQYLDPVACMLVKKLCEETDAKIVISGESRCTYDYRATRAILNAACSDLGEHVLKNSTYWRTRDSVKESPNTISTHRGREVHAWITEAPYEVRNFVVLDDLLSINPYTENFVRCEPFNGILGQTYPTSIAK